MPGSTFLQGETVSLRTVEEEDLDMLKEAVNDPRVWRPIGHTTPANAVQEQKFFEEFVCDDSTVNLLVTVEETPVGLVELGQFRHEPGCCELGYWIAPEHQQQGYATDAVSRLVTYGFDQRALHRIEAKVFGFNSASQHLLEDLGFTLDGRLRDRVFVDGEYHDLLWYGLLADEW